MSVPRCFIIRHGETEWSRLGKHTSTTDLHLTEHGKERIRATGRALVGEDRLIVPRRLVHIYVSPRTRAQQTLSLLQLGSTDRLSWDEKFQEHLNFHTNAHIEVTDAVREWDYGDYEGLTSTEIRDVRRSQGIPEWDIWRHGCPGGESPEQVVARLDRLIETIRTRYHKPKEGTVFQKAQRSADVVIVAHGHILRALALRWIGKPLAEGAFILEAGGVSTLSYQHHSIDEPAILLGGSFVVPEAAQQ